MKIVKAKLSDLAPFFEYLDGQLVENTANDSPLFQPIAKNHSHVSDQLRLKFRNGFESNVGEVGWRQLWLLKDEMGTISGHIDLRHNNSEYCFHRVLLGMGVARTIRKQGLGIKLVNTAVQYCRDQDGIDWLDLNVLSNNTPAKKLYLKCGFTVTGEVSDYYRIDGESVSEIAMTVSTKNNSDR